MAKILARATGANYFLVDVRVVARSDKAIQVEQRSGARVKSWIPCSQVVREFMNGVLVKPWIVQQRRAEFDVQGIIAEPTVHYSRREDSDPDYDRDYEFGGW